MHKKYQANPWRIDWVVAVLLPESNNVVFSCLARSCWKDNKSAKSLFSSAASFWFSTYIVCTCCVSPCHCCLSLKSSMLRSLKSDVLMVCHLPQPVPFFSLMEGPSLVQCFLFIISLAPLAHTVPFHSISQSHVMWTFRFTKSNACHMSRSKLMKWFLRSDFQLFP